MSHRITAVEVKDYKRIRDVKITPDSDAVLILIGGMNGNGKTSLLDALSNAFGGKRTQPADPVRRGSDGASIRVELDGGDLEVHRVILPDGESALEVRGRIGSVKSPQAMLDKMVGARFLDPLAFLSLPAKEQRATLMRLIPNANQIAELNEKRQRAFDRRTEIGRDLTRAEGELSRLSEVAVETPIDVVALNAEVRDFAAKQRAGDALGAEVRKIEAMLISERAVAESVMQRVERLEREIAQARAELPVREAAINSRARELATAQGSLQAAADHWANLAPRRAQLDADLARADAHNRGVFAAEAQNKRRAEAAFAVTRLDSERRDLTKSLESIDARKSEVLAASSLPVEGLAFSEHGIEMNGVPLAQASDAEKWRVALGLAIAASPDLDDVWIRDGALLDEDSLAIVAKHAGAFGKRVWIERVGTRDHGVIEIRDGRVVSSATQGALPL